MIKSKQITLNKQNPSKCLLKDCLVDSYFLLTNHEWLPSQSILWFDLEGLDDSFFRYKLRQQNMKS